MHWDSPVVRVALVATAIALEAHRSLDHVPPLAQVAVPVVGVATAAEVVQQEPEAAVLVVRQLASWQFLEAEYPPRRLRAVPAVLRVLLALRYLAVLAVLPVKQANG